MKAKPGVSTQNLSSKPHTHGGVEPLPHGLPKKKEGQKEDRQTYTKPPRKSKLK
jgi:hypothetical protein